MENKEITCMQLVWEEDEVPYILLICSDSKTIYVYDEEDNSESRLLRTITGAHEEEITIFKYDEYLALLAVGSVSGEISVWDFEMSKVEAYCLAHKGDISGIEFLSPLPLMLTSSMDCRVCLWGVRPCPLKYRYMCLY